MHVATTTLMNMLCCTITLMNMMCYNNIHEQIVIVPLMNIAVMPQTHSNTKVEHTTTTPQMSTLQQHH